jgi:hypothetical protein
LQEQSHWRNLILEDFNVIFQPMRYSNPFLRPYLNASLSHTESIIKMLKVEYSAEISKRYSICVLVNEKGYTEVRIGSPNGENIPHSPAVKMSLKQWFSFLNHSQEVENALKGGKNEVAATLGQPGKYFLYLTTGTWNSQKFVFLALSSHGLHGKIFHIKNTSLWFTIDEYNAIISCKLAVKEAIDEIMKRDAEEKEAGVGVQEDVPLLEFETQEMPLFPYFPADDEETLVGTQGTTTTTEPPPPPAPPKKLRKVLLQSSAPKKSDI